MSLSKGAKRLTNRKRATPATSKLSEVKPAILPSNLETPIFGMDPELQKEFSAPTAGDLFGVPVTYKERDIIAEKSIKHRRKLPVLAITDVTFTIMTHEELERESVFEVKNKEQSGLFSVNDPRGGIVDQHVSCVTCQKDYLECSGHLGMLRLYQPIVHPMMRKELIHVLNSVCASCGSLLLPVETLRAKKVFELVGSARLKQISKLSEKVPCRRNVDEVEGVAPCIQNPIYKLENGNIVYTRDEKSKSMSIILSIESIETILDSISQEDALTLGFEGKSHPRRFIMRSLPIIPLCARAPVVQEGMVLPDDLTSMYIDITGLNLKIGRSDITEEERKAMISNLIYKIEHLYNNTDGKYTALKKNPYQSIQERIQGKEALIRKALMGKRVNYSARAVIDPDPTLKFGQIRIPRVMAPYLTQHEIVGPENIRKLTALLRKGQITYITPVSGKFEGKKIRVNKKIQEEQSLKFGDEVDRWLENGDWVVYNRQPTLHKQGMMGYEVVLGDGLTTGLHLGYTKQHNAD